MFLCLVGFSIRHGLHWCNNDTNSSLAGQHVNWGKPTEGCWSGVAGSWLGGTDHWHYSRLCRQQKGTKAVSETDGQHYRFEIVCLCHIL